MNDEGEALAEPSHELTPGNGRGPFGPVKVLRAVAALALLAVFAWPELAEAHWTHHYHRHAYVVVERPPPAVGVVTVAGIPVAVVPVRREPVYRPVRVYRRRY